MSILSAFSMGVMAASGAVSEVAAGGGDRYFGEWAPANAAGMRVTPERAKRLATVYACVEKKATALAMLPFKIYKADGNGGSTLARHHPLYDVLYSKPNQLQTAFEFKQMMQAHVELRGNAYAEIIPGPRGAVDELRPMHPDYVRVEQLMGSGRLRYQYNDPILGKTRLLMQDEVFHLRNMPDTMGVGQSRISHGCEMLGLALLQQDYNARFMANDATPGAIITGAAYKSVEDEDKFVESLQRSRTKENRGRPFLMPSGMDMKSLAVSPVDAELLDSIKASDVRICTLFGVLPHVIGVDAGKSATFASTEQFNLMHVQQTVLPMAICWEQRIQIDLITSPLFFAKASVASLMRGDAGTRGKFYQLLVSSGIANVDEIRALEDMNPVPDGSGKRFWNPLNWGLLNRNPAIAPTGPGGRVPMGAAAADEEDDGSEGGEEDDAPDSEQAAVTLPLIQTLVKHGRTRPEGVAA